MITLLRGDIIEQRVDVIVTAANAELVGGGGVDGAVHRACGPQLLEALRPFGGCPIGSAVRTRAFDLERNGVRHIVHAVGPIYDDGTHDEPTLLAKAYTTSMRLAHETGAQSIAFPAISAGAYGYPLHEAATIAITAVSDVAHVDDIRFVLFSDDAVQAFTEALQTATRESRRRPRRS